MSRLCLAVLGLALVSAACAPRAPGAVSPEAVAVYLIGHQPLLDTETHEVLGTYALSGGGLVSADRMLRHLRTEGARVGAEYVIVLAPTNSRGSMERTAQGNGSFGDLHGSLRHTQRVAFIAVGRKAAEPVDAPAPVVPLAAATAGQ
jgi:hypothetical protein